MYLQRSKRLFLGVGAMLCLSGCAANRLPETGVALSGPQSTGNGLEQAISALKPDANEIVRFSFCEADAKTGQCLEPTVGLTGYGLGGLFLPLLVRVDGFELRRDDATQGDGPIEIKFSTNVNGISPLCERTDAEFEVLEGRVLRLGATPFYCNWVVIGNVVTQIEFGIDRVNTQSRSFSGSGHRRHNVKSSPCSHSLQSASNGCRKATTRYSAGDTAVRPVITVSAPGSGCRGTNRASTSETPAIPAPSQNTAAGWARYTYPSIAGRKTAAI